MKLDIRETADGHVINFRVQPGAKRSKIIGEHGGAVKVAIAAPPVDGKANDALIEFLCDTLSLKKSQVEIVRGQTSRDKSVLIRDMSDEAMGKLIVLLK